MLRIRKAKAEHAKKYFDQSLSASAYYMEGQEHAGYWGGRGAELLGLQGTVDGDSYRKLCDNINPRTGKRLTARNAPNRIALHELGFSVPKPVSAVRFLKGDERIMPMLDRALRETMNEIEEKINTRVRKGGVQDGNRAAANLISATFLHLTARPEGRVPDPQIHWHVMIFNATLDEEEQEWKAINLREVMTNANYYQARFLSRVSEGMKELGYEVESQGKWFTLAGWPRELTKKFSKRAERIEAEAKRRGITSDAEKDKLAALTRQKKVKDVPMPELVKAWREQLAPEEERLINSLGTSKTRHQEIAATATKRSADELGKRGSGFEVVKSPKSRTVGRMEAFDEGREEVMPGISRYDWGAMSFAVEHVFFSHSVATQALLVQEALNWGQGLTTIKGVEAAMKQMPLRWIEKNGRRVATTPEVVLEELRVVSKAKEGRGKFPVFSPSWRIRDERLNDQQREAVFHVLDSRDFVTGIEGKAGVGKTTVLTEIAKALNEAGHRVLAFAPSAMASRGTLRESGFPAAETVAKLLTNKSLQAAARGAVWFVDEGALLSTHATDRLLALAERLGSRVVMVGDSGQHHSVERGDGFRLIHEHAEVAFAKMDKIVRQSGLYKLAIQYVDAKKYNDAFRVLEEMNAIVEIEDMDTRNRAIAEHYLATLDKGRTALLVSPSHDECEVVTDMVRRTLKAQGRITEGRQWEVLVPVHETPAQLSRGESYREGQVVRVSGHLKGFALGETLEVISAGRAGVRARSTKGVIKTLPLEQHEKFNVYERDQIELCKGERIKITINTHNAEGHPLLNGSFYTVKGFTAEGDMILENGWRVPRGFAHIDHGYTRTSHSAQSTTVDVIIIAQSGRLSMAASDCEQFYTSLSRGSREPKLFTDFTEGLRENVAWQRPREMVMDLMKEQEIEEDYAMEMEI